MAGRRRLCLTERMQSRQKRWDFWKIAVLVVAFCVVVGTFATIVTTELVLRLDQ